MTVPKPAMTDRPHTLPGRDGQPVVLRAWCPTCHQEAMPHSKTGCCMFCDTPTIPLDNLGDPIAFIVHKRPGHHHDQRAYQGRRWTEQQMIQAIQTWTVDHGREPCRPDWQAATPDHPCTSAVQYRFGSWDKAKRIARNTPRDIDRTLRAAIR